MNSMLCRKRSFYLTTCAVFLSVSYAFAAQAPEQQELSLMELPKDVVIQHIMISHPSNMALLKQVSKFLNESYDYCMISPETIGKIDEVICTQWLCRLAQTKQKKNFEYFFNNNSVEQRKKSLEILGWKDADSVEKYMQAHCGSGNIILTCKITRAVQPSR